jgi:hypothetical protein
MERHHIQKQQQQKNMAVENKVTVFIPVNYLMN